MSLVVVREVLALLVLCQCGYSRNANLGLSSLGSSTVTVCFVGPVRRPRVDEGERLLLVVPTRNWSWSSGLLGLGVLLRLVRELNCELAWLLLQLGLLLLVYLACWTHWARNLLHLGVPGCSKCAVFTLCVGYYMRFLIYRKMEVSRQWRSAGRGALSLSRQI